jgi:HAD superfamily hydrolase (TIGR01549 family)
MQNERVLSNVRRANPQSLYHRRIYFSRFDRNQQIPVVFEHWHARNLGMPQGGNSLLDHVDAITFDDFNTLRYEAEGERDIIYAVLRVLQVRTEVNEDDFLAAYVQADRTYRRELAETLRESLLDNIILDVATSLGLKLALNSRTLCWYADATKTLLTLQERGYRLGLITNTHWRIPESLRTEFDRYFSVISVSHEHGYAKPHPSIFLRTLQKLEVIPNRCVHVGDDPVADIEGARDVGMRTVFVKRSDNHADADITVLQLSDLLSLLPRRP